MFTKESEGGRYDVTMHLLRPPGPLWKLSTNVEFSGVEEAHELTISFMFLDVHESFGYLGEGARREMLTWARRHSRILLGALDPLAAEATVADFLMRRFPIDEFGFPPWYNAKTLLAMKSCLGVDSLDRWSHDL